MIFWKVKSISLLIVKEQVCIAPTLILLEPSNIFEAYIEINDYAINITLLYQDVESMKLDSSQCYIHSKGKKMQPFMCLKLKRHYLYENCFGGHNWLPIFKTFLWPTLSSWFLKVDGLCHPRLWFFSFVNNVKIQWTIMYALSGSPEVEVLNFTKLKYDIFLSTYMEWSWKLGLLYQLWGSVINIIIVTKLKSDLFYQLWGKYFGDNFLKRA